MNRVVAAVAALTGFVGAACAQQADAPAGNVGRGKLLYEQVGCYACHGLSGQGALATGPRLSRTQYPFAAFLVMLRQPTRQMPPYQSAILPDRDAADIYAYLRQMPAPRDPKGIALLNAER